METEKYLYFVITDGGRSNGGATAEGLEACIDDLSGFVVDLNLKLHHIAARRCPNQTRSHARVILVEGTNVTRVVVVFHDPLVVQPRRNPNPQSHRSRNPQPQRHLLFSFPLTQLTRPNSTEIGK